jgi:hypothetical protein
MTLVELLVGMGISGAVAAMTFGVAFSAQRLWRLQRDRCAASRAGWQWLDSASAELRAAVPPEKAGEAAEIVGRHSSAGPEGAAGTAAPPSGSDGPVADAFSRDVIRFPSPRVMDAEGNLVPGIVEYSLHADGSGNPLGIARRAAPMGTPLSESEPVVKVPQAVSLGFEYMDARGRWSNEWTHARVLPRAVRLAVVVVAPTAQGEVQHVSFSTMVRLPAAGGTL